MRSFNPKVSIVIPVYNGSNFLREAIESALGQSYKNIEVVVVNDGSTDNGATEKIAKSFGNRISYYNKVNGGVATALNLGIEKMTGEYFSWLSHDDLYEKSKIKEQVEYLEKVGSHNTVVACNASVLFASGIKKKTYIDKDTFAFTDIFLATSAVVGVNGCSLLIPRDALLRSGGFDNKLPYTQDYDLWFRLAKECKFHLLEKHLIISRRHEEQDSVKKQLLCYLAAEELHYGFLNQIPYKHFEKMFDDNMRALDNFMKNYEVYRAGGYTKTASMMLKYLVEYYSGKDAAKQGELISSNIGDIGNSNEQLQRKKAKPRVMFFSNVWHKGGIERVLSMIFNGLGDKYDFFLVTNNDTTDEKLGYPLDKHTHHIKINNQNQLAELANLISLFEIDVFVGNPNFLASFIDIYPLLSGMNVKSVAYNHGHFLLPYMVGDALYPTAVKLKESYSAADRVIWLSKVAQGVYSIDSDNGLYLPNSISTDVITRQKKSPKKNILSVGRFDDAIKQIDKLLLVFQELHKLSPDYHLTVVGHCPMDMILAERNGITLAEFISQQQIPIRNISFVGEQENVERYYDEADFLLLTSKCEGFALVLVEAMSRGVPCAGLHYIGIEEIIQNGKNGWVSQQEDFSGLANDINATLENKALFKSMSRTAIESTAQFNSSIFVKRWHELLESLINPYEANNTSLFGKVELSREELEGVIVEYKRLLNVSVSNYLSKPQLIELQAVDPVARTKRNRVEQAINRTKHSIREDGVYLTGEKISRKVYAKVKNKLHR